MKQGRDLKELAQEVIRQNKAKKDFIIDTRKVTMSQWSDGNVIQLQDDAGEWSAPFPVSETAHRQIGQYLGIHAKYYDKMRTEYPELLATNVNSWFHQNSDTRMVRLLDDRMRAFLSDKYKILDNYQIMERVMPIISRMQGAKIASCELTESRMYIKVINPRITAQVVKGDVVQAGVVISNSETGQGSVAIRPLIFRLVCSNGMIAADEGQKRYHIGRVNEAAQDSQIFRSETIAADEKAFLMKIEDTVHAAVEQANFTRIVNRMAESIEAKLNTKNIPKVIELTAADYGFSKDEENGVLSYLVQGGDLSLYGMANAVTRYSQDVESYDRATELEATGWNIVTMPARRWNQINSLHSGE